MQARASTSLTTSAASLLKASRCCPAPAPLPRSFPAPWLCAPTGGTVGLRWQQPKRPQMDANRGSCPCSSKFACFCSPRSLLLSPRLSRSRARLPACSFAPGTLPPPPPAAAAAHHQRDRPSATSPGLVLARCHRSSPPSPSSAAQATASLDSLAACAQNGHPLLPPGSGADYPALRSRVSSWRAANRTRPS